MLKEVSKVMFNDQTSGFTEKLARSRGWIFHRVAFPIIDCEFYSHGWQGIRVKLVCTDWNERPPSIELLNSEGGALTPNEIPQGTGVFNPSLHQNTQRPFICMRGSHEYHTHPSHINDQWSPLRGKTAYSLGEIISQLWNAWKKDRKQCLV